MKILLTGATGCIGRALYHFLLKQNHEIVCVFRANKRAYVKREYRACKFFFIDDLNGHTCWDDAFEGIDVVIHLAALAHMITKTDFEQHRRFLTVNFEGTRRLAVQAAQKGVKRFIFISSIGVNGKSSQEKPFTEQDIENPHNSYTVAKFNAEHALREIEGQTSMEVTIVRPPLVYGPYVKANFLKLLNLVHTGIPLPFEGIGNKRSFIALENLVDAICVCVDHENAGGKTFIVSDGNALSTEALIRKIAKAMGKPSRLFPVPDMLMKCVLGLSGRKRIYERLWGDLSVDSSKIQQDLDWIPPVSMDQAIENTVRWYLKSCL
jgi:UDP-N-acetyl-alpha-D-quinovosamine dehydrogenase